MGRAPCCDKVGLKKGPWTAQEDQILMDFIHRNGHGNWRALPKQAGLLRCGKSCRLRWTNYLAPDIKRGNFSPEEEAAIINLQQLLGNRWSTIASRLPGRTDNEIKNVWNTRLKKRLQRNGIDPVTHAVATHSTSSPSHSFNSVHKSEYSGDSHVSHQASPSMKQDTLKDNLALPGPSQPKPSSDSPTTFMNLSDSFYDSHDLSSEIFTSMNSLDSESVSADSSSRLDCVNSFEVALGYDQQRPAIDQDETKLRQDILMDDTFILKNQNFAGEERWFSWESQDATGISTSKFIRPDHISKSKARYFKATNTEDGFLSSVETVETSTHQPLDFHASDGNSDGTDYWLDFLSEAMSSPTSYQVVSLCQT